MRNIRNSKGFTLIELMIVVVIIGILAAIAIPRFTNVSKSAKEGEADPILKQAYSLQESYKQRYDTYASETNLRTIGWDPTQTDAEYYSFAVTSADASTFCVAATLKSGVTTGTVDPKYIDEQRSISKTAC